MIADTIGSLLLFTLISFGLAWPLAARVRCSASEKVLTSVSLSFIGSFLFAWAVYVWRLPLRALWALPIISLIAALVYHKALVEVWRDRDARELIVTQTLVTGWCVGWLALVLTYSGGGWIADWFGHWERTVFFLERGWPHVLYYGFDPVASRPPLANVVIGAYITLTRYDFAHYQLATTFFCSLAFLPAALLTKRFARTGGVSILAVLLMLSPMFLQNATFPWTKLPAAFFTLGSVYYFLRGFDANRGQSGLICAVCLAGAILTHYSAGPYAVVIAGAWIARGWSRRKMSSPWPETLGAATIGAALLSTWFAWAISVYGFKGAFLTNTSVTDLAPTASEQALNVALNIRDTVVPHFLRDVAYGPIVQVSPWGWWRDWFFQLYQINLVFAFGCITWLVIAVLLARRGRASDSTARICWGLAITSIIVLGIVVHGARDHWGLAHICLQPLVLLGLAFFAACWETIGQVWRRIVVAGLTIDFLLGIVLHFGAQSSLLDRWLTAYRSLTHANSSYSPYAIANLREKLTHEWVFFGDGFSPHYFLVLTYLSVILILAIFRRGRESPSAGHFERNGFPTSSALVPANNLHKTTSFWKNKPGATNVAERIRRDRHSST